MFPCRGGCRPGQGIVAGSVDGHVVPAPHAEACFRAFGRSAYNRRWNTFLSWADVPIADPPAVANPTDRSDDPATGSEAQWLPAQARAVLAYEWTWAAQGRDQQRNYPWGDAPATCERSIIDTDVDDDYRGCGLGRPWPVGSRAQDVTRDGVYDMEGNLGENTTTPFRTDYPFGYLRDAMGDSWRTLPDDDIGGAGAPITADSVSDNGGFRCAKDPGPRPPCTVAP